MQALDRGGVFEPQIGGRRRRRCRRLDSAQHKAGRPDALEVEVAGEVVAAGAKRFERRAQAGAERDVCANQGRGALLDRDAHLVELLRQPGGLDRLHPHHDAVSALSLLANLDEARDGDVAGRARQNRMRHRHGGERRDRKAARDRGAGKPNRKGDRPSPRENGNSAAGRRQPGARPPGRLMAGGEIERDAEAEGDRQPRQQSRWPGPVSAMAQSCRRPAAARPNSASVPVQTRARRRCSATSQVRTLPWA
jgi:hypothetical protein